MLKQWDAALDGRTRDSHRMVDGEIREIDEKFSNGLMFPGDPNGSAAEVVNCRCVSNSRARWGLDESELETLKERAEYFGLDKSDSFEDYKKNYLKAAKEVDNSEKGGNIKLNLQFFAEKDLYKQESNSLKRAIRKYEAQIEDHHKKLDNPKSYISDWDSKDIREQNGLKNHWNKEIKTFRQSVEDRIDELKKRGDYDE